MASNTRDCAEERPNIFEALHVAEGPSFNDEEDSVLNLREAPVSGEDDTSDEEPFPPEDGDTPSKESDSSEETDTDDQTATTFSGETAKDGTKWNRHENPRLGKTPSRNVFKASGNQAPGCQNANTPRDTYRLFFSDKMINDIVKFTNIEGSRVMKEKWDPMDEVEFEGLLGILLFLGTRKQGFVATEMLWDTVYGVPLVRSVMSRRRFQFLMTHLRFDDKASRSVRRQRDAFSAFRDIWEEFLKKLSQHYVPGCFLTVDEQLVPFRGRCRFTQYLPSKPDRYGIKIFWVVDSKSNFPLSGIPYLGRAAGQPRALNLDQTTVIQLVTPFFKNGRNITCDNFFKEKVLTETLLKNGLTVVGTVRQNKTFLPESFKGKAKLPEHASKFMFNDNHALVLYQSKRNKQVVLMSTMHDTGIIEETPSNKKRKPEMVLFYNETKGAVDTLDKMAHAYTTKRKTNRWPMIMFFNILDLSTIAARVIWKLRFPENKLSHVDERATFIHAVSEELSLQQMKRRSANVNLPRSLQDVMQKTTQHLEARYGPSEERLKGRAAKKAAESQEACSSSESASKKRKCCLFCYWKQDRKTQQRCKACNEYICTEHTVRDCPNCIKSNE